MSLPFKRSWSLLVFILVAAVLQFPHNSAQAQQPVAEQLIPSEGQQGDQNIQVTLIGQNFQESTELYFETTELTIDGPIIFMSPGEIQFVLDIAPNAGIGSYDLFVFNPDGLEGWLPDAFSVTPKPTPRIDSVYPFEAYQGDTGVAVTIYGEHLGDTGYVDFGDGISIDSVGSITDTQIDGTISIDMTAIPGYRTIQLWVGTEIFELVDGFEVLELVAEPLLESVFPSEMQAGDGGSVLIYGANLGLIETVDFGDGITIDSFTAQENDLEAVLSIDLDATPGLRDITVICTNGDATLPGGFEVLPPDLDIELIEPNQGHQGDVSLPIEIHGTGLDLAEGLELGGMTAFINEKLFTVITAEIDIPTSAPPGYYDVRVFGPYGEDILPGGFEVLPTEPAPESIVPEKGAAGGTIPATIYGEYLSLVDSVEIGPLEVTVLNTQHNQVEIEIFIPPETIPGFYDLKVTSPAGFTMLPGRFEVFQHAPNIESIIPDQGTQGESVPATIHGQGLSNIDSVEIGSLDVEILGSTESGIDVEIWIDYEAPAGFYGVHVEGPNGEADLPGAFEVIPRVISISVDLMTPTEAVRGEQTPVTFHGSGLGEVDIVDFGPDIEVVILDVSEVKIEVEIVALELKSIEPIQVRVVSGTDTFFVPDLFDIRPGIPWLEYFEPDTGYRGWQDEEVTLVGLNLDGITGLRIGDGTQDINIQGVSLDDPTTARIRIDVGMGVDCTGHEIIIEHPGGEIVLDQRLQILPGGLDVEQIIPDSAYQGTQQLGISLFGRNMDTVTHVDFGDGITVFPGQYVSHQQGDLFISIDESATVGSRDVMLSNEFGDYTIVPDGFEVIEPPLEIPEIKIFEVVPDEGRQGEEIEIKIFGEGFKPGAEVEIGPGISDDLFSQLFSSMANQGELQAQGIVREGAQPGTYDVKVTNPDGNFDILPDGFEIIPEEEPYVPIGPTLELGPYVLEFSIPVEVIIPYTIDALMEFEVRNSGEGSADNLEIRITDLESDEGGPIIPSDVFRILLDSTKVDPGEEIPGRLEFSFEVTPDMFPPDSTDQRSWTGELEAVDPESGVSATADVRITLTPRSIEPGQIPGEGLKFSPESGELNGTDFEYTMLVVHTDALANQSSGGFFELNIMDPDAREILEIDIPLTGIGFSNYSPLPDFGPAAIPLGFSLVRIGEVNENFGSENFTFMVWNGGRLIGQSTLSPNASGNLTVEVSTLGSTAEYSLAMIWPWDDPCWEVWSEWMRLQAELEEGCSYEIDSPNEAGDALEDAEGAFNEASSALWDAMSGLIDANAELNNARIAYGNALQDARDFFANHIFSNYITFSDPGVPGWSSVEAFDGEVTVWFLGDNGAELLNDFTSEYIDEYNDVRNLLSVARLGLEEAQDESDRINDVLSNEQLEFDAADALELAQLAFNESLIAFNECNEKMNEIRNAIAFLEWYYIDCFSQTGFGPGTGIGGEPGAGLPGTGVPVTGEGVSGTGVSDGGLDDDDYPCGDADDEWEALQEAEAALSDATDELGNAESADDAAQAGIDAAQLTVDVAQNAKDAAQEDFDRLQNKLDSFMQSHVFSNMVGGTPDKGPNYIQYRGVDIFFRDFNAYWNIFRIIREWIDEIADEFDDAQDQLNHANNDLTRAQADLAKAHVDVISAQTRIVWAKIDFVLKELLRNAAKEAYDDRVNKVSECREAMGYAPGTFPQYEDEYPIAYDIDGDVSGDGDEGADGTGTPGQGTGGEGSDGDGEPVGDDDCPCGDCTKEGNAIIRAQNAMRDAQEAYDAAATAIQENREWFLQLAKEIVENEEALEKATERFENASSYTHEGLEERRQALKEMTRLEVLISGLWYFRAIASAKWQSQKAALRAAEEAWKAAREALYEAGLAFADCIRRFEECKRQHNCPDDSSQDEEQQNYTPPNIPGEGMYSIDPFEFDITEPIGDAEFVPISGPGDADGGGDSQDGDSTEEDCPCEDCLEELARLNTAKEASNESFKAWYARAMNVTELRKRYAESTENLAKLEQAIASVENLVQILRERIADYELTGRTLDLSPEAAAIRNEQEKQELERLEAYLAGLRGSRATYETEVLDLASRLRDAMIDEQFLEFTYEEASDAYFEALFAYWDCLEERKECLESHPECEDVPLEPRQGGLNEEGGVDGKGGSKSINDILPESPEQEGSPDDVLEIMEEIIDSIYEEIAQANSELSSLEQLASDLDAHLADAMVAEQDASDDMYEAENYYLELVDGLMLLLDPLPDEVIYLENFVEPDEGWLTFPIPDGGALVYPLELDGEVNQWWTEYEDAWNPAFSEIPDVYDEFMEMAGLWRIASGEVWLEEVNLADTLAEIAGKDAKVEVYEEAKQHWEDTFEDREDALNELQEELVDLIDSITGFLKED